MRYDDKMLLESLQLTHQLSQNLNPENLRPKISGTEQVQTIARVEKRTTPTFLGQKRQNIIENLQLDNLILKPYPKIESTPIDLKNDKFRMQAILLVSKKSLCSGTIFTNKSGESWFLTAGHCIDPETKLLMQNNIQFLNPVEIYGNDQMTDASTAIPMAAVIKYMKEYTLKSLKSITPKPVQKIMDSYNNSTSCVTGSLFESYNINGMTMKENPNYLENGFQTGVQSLVGQPGKSGSIVFIAGHQNNKQ